MVNRIVSVGDDFTLPSTTKVTDVNLPSRLSAASLGAAYVKVNEAPLNVARYGAVADGVTNNSAAFNAALSDAAAATRGEVYVPRGSSFYKTVATITVPGGVRLYSDARTEIRGTSAAATMTLAAASSGQKIEGIYLTAAGGGIPLVILDAYLFSFTDCLMVQYSASQPIIYHEGTGSFIDATFEKCELNAAPGANISPVLLVNSGNGLNSTRWRNMRLNGNATMTAPFFRIASTGGAGVYSHDHSFRDITAEICPAGVIHGESVYGVTVDAVSPWDVTTYTDDIFKFTTNAAGGASPCGNIVVQNSGRRGGTLAPGKFDVNFSSQSQNVAALFMSPTTAGEANVGKVNLPNSNGVVIGSGGMFMQHAYGNITQMAAISSGDRGTVGALGAHVFDGTLKKPLWGDGTKWRDAAGNIVP